MHPERARCYPPLQLSPTRGESGFAAGGVELAAWCDIRVASTTARFGCLERRWGVPLIDGGTVRLPRIVGLGRALDMILTGRPVPAEEAVRIGLMVERVKAARVKVDQARYALWLQAYAIDATFIKVKGGSE